MRRLLNVALLIGGVLMSLDQDPLRAADLEPFTEQSVESQGKTFKYRLLAPVRIEPGVKYPVVLFLHGAGERGVDNEKQLQYFPEMMAQAEYQRKFPCFVVAPQCRAGKMWVNLDWSSKQSIPMDEPTADMAAAVAALEQVLDKHPVDARRIYLTGLSMGGYGAWDLAARQPERFAAVVPICGGGDEKQAAKLKNLPIWAWHGDQDNAVPVERSRSMIEAIQAAGGEPKYTELPGVGHNSWTPAYTAEDGVVPWMFLQKKS